MTPIRILQAVEELAQRGIDVAAEEFCDALWLVRSGIVALSAAVPLPEPAKPNPPDSPQSKPTEARDPSRPPPPPGPGAPSPQPADPLSSQGSAYALGSTSESEVRGSLVALAGPPAIGRSVALDRALRVLRRKRPLAGEVEFDEEATAAAVSETRIWHVVTRPKLGRWLDVSLVIEQSPSMRIWQDAAHQFRRLLERAAGLSMLKPFYLRYRDGRPEIATAGGRQTSPAAVLGTGTRHRVLFVSDAMSSGWLTGDVPRLLESWSRWHPTTLVQVLPPHLWSQTSLEHADLQPLSDKSAAAAARGLPIPQIAVTAIHPQMLGEFARAVVGAPRPRLAAYGNGWKEFRVDMPESNSDSAPFDPTALPPEQIEAVFTQFEQTASPDARLLARHLASAPLVLPVMRLVQRTLVPDALPYQLAEIFYSGMLFRRDAGVLPEPHPNRIEYEFLPGLRQRLLNAGGLDCAFDTLRVLSRYVNEHFGQGDHFLAVIAGANQSGSKWRVASESAELRPFARIADFVMTRLGIKPDAPVPLTPGDSDFDPNELPGQPRRPSEQLSETRSDSNLAEPPRKESSLDSHEPAGSPNEVLIEALARSLHQVWLKELDQLGRLNEDLERPWIELTDSFKKSLRASAVDIVTSIAQLAMEISGVENPSPAIEQLTDDEIEIVGMAAQQRWMDAKFRAGWTYVLQRDTANKLDPGLVPWEKLPDSARDVSRRHAKRIPVVVSRAGYKLVRTPHPTSTTKPTTAKPPTKIFLSYHRNDDQSFVRRLHADLTTAGFDVWLDAVSMPSRNLTFHQEIRDAIAASDSLLLIIGPHAVASVYVSVEWRFAYFEAEKIVTPILRQGDYSLVPDELKLLHCEDFRDDSRYATCLEALVRGLSESPLPVGKLIGVPDLPVHLLPRPEELSTLQDAILADLNRPVVNSGASARVGMHGMAGVGKTVLASLLARDRRIRQAFPDGIAWIGLGNSPDVRSLLHSTYRALGGDDVILDAYDGRRRLQELLREKAVLLVLDGAWRRTDVEPFFKALGPRCRVLITTRDAGLLAASAGLSFATELLTVADARTLLASWVGTDREALPTEADDLIVACGCLPLAVSLCGGLIRKGRTWNDVLDSLQKGRIERIADRNAVDPHHLSVWAAIHVSVETLSQVERERFLELAIFSAGEAIPESAVATLWSVTGGFDEWETRGALEHFTAISLVRTTASEVAGSSEASTSVRFVSLHVLVLEYARQAKGSLQGLHEKMIAAYRAKCPAGWSTGPNDGYFFTHLRNHLVGAGLVDELADLLQQWRWLEAKNVAGWAFDLLYDYRAALDALPEREDRRKILQLLSKALRRELSSINRHREDHPHGLFQSLWNLAWWYDCPQSTKFFGPDYEPAKSAGPKMYELMERWQMEREAAYPRFPWSRLSRPPAIPLHGPLLAVLRSDMDEVASVGFSPDGTRIVTGSTDRTVRLWDARTGAQLQLLRGHETQVYGAAFSPDGTRIVSASHDKTIRQWDAQTGAELQVIRGHVGSVCGVAFAPDGMRIVSGSKDRTVRVWDARTGAELHVLRGHENYVHGVAFSSDGARIVSGSTDMTVRLWDGQSGAELQVLRGHQSNVFSVAFSPDGLTIVSGSSDNTVRLWDSRTGAALSVLHGEAGSVNSVAFSPDGKRIVSGSSDGTVRTWELASGRALAVFDGKSNSVESVAYSRDGSLIVSGSGNGTVRIWDTALV